jgi:hypothetical protein
VASLVVAVLTRNGDEAAAPPGTGSVPGGVPLSEATEIGPDEWVVPSGAPGDRAEGWLRNLMVVPTDQLPIPPSSADSRS